MFYVGALSYFNPNDPNDPNASNASNASNAFISPLDIVRLAKRCAR